MPFRQGRKIRARVCACVNRAEGRNGIWQSVTTRDRWRT